MKVKRVTQCKCCGLHYFNNLNDNYCETCLQFIKEYTNQVRKQLIEEIKEKSIKNYTLEHRIYTYCIEPKVLEQIEKGEN